MQKKKKASVLVFSLVILFISLVAALGVASTSLISQKMSGATAKSTASFQVADSGAEIILKKIKDASGSQTIVDVFAFCENSIVGGQIADGKTYQISFMNEDGANLDCNSPISDIAKIKSVGNYAGTSRAIEAALAAGNCECEWYESANRCITQNEFDQNKPTGICQKIGGNSANQGYGHVSSQSMSGAPAGSIAGCFVNSFNSCGTIGNSYAGTIRYYGCSCEE